MSGRLLEKTVSDKLINGFLLHKRKLGYAYKYNIKPAGIFTK